MFQWYNRKYFIWEHSEVKYQYNKVPFLSKDRQSVCVVLCSDISNMHILLFLVCWGWISDCPEDEERRFLRKRQILVYWVMKAGDSKEWGREFCTTNTCATMWISNLSVAFLDYADMTFSQICSLIMALACMCHFPQFSM